MNTIALVEEALENLGFDASLHSTLHTYFSLQVSRFSVLYKTVKERDVLKFNLFFQRKENSYSCLYYDAILRKEIILPDTIIDTINIKDLDEQMNLINWKELFNKEENISSIIDDLKILDSSKEGKLFSEQLKVKYWSDTPLENTMNIFFLKQKFEISQRFYFPENGTGISIEEAYRFLTNKWMERQLKRKPVQVAATAPTKPVSKSKKKKEK